MAHSKTPDYVCWSVSVALYFVFNLPKSFFPSFWCLVITDFSCCGNLFLSGAIICWSMGTHQYKAGGQGLQQAWGWSHEKCTDFYFGFHISTLFNIFCFKYLNTFVVWNKCPLYQLIVSAVAESFDIKVILYRSLLNFVLCSNKQMLCHKNRLIRTITILTFRFSAPVKSMFTE